MSFPTKKEMEKVLKELESTEPTFVLDRDSASAADRVKYDLCREFVVYLKSKNITQAELAEELGIDRGRVNKIVKYRIEYFTIDKLLKLLNLIQPDKELKVS